MKTKLLICALVPGLGMWAAAQFIQGRVNYYYRPVQHPVVASHAYKGAVTVVTRRGGLNVSWWPDRGERVSFGPNSASIAAAGPLDEYNRPLVAPNRIVHDDGGGIVTYVVFLPYWLFVAPPALLLAVRLWRRRRSNRGFEVQPAA